MESNKEKLSKLNINWYPGHMAKTKRQVVEDLKLIDVVIEILDARIPISSQNPDMREITSKKKKIIVLNKSDLADEKSNIEWKNYFEKIGIPTVIADSNSGKGIGEVVRKIGEVMKKDLQEQAQKGRIGKAIRVMVLGIPNVGKSSFINRIANRTSARVGNKPGVTVQKQWIRVANNIELLDTPGVLWPKFENEQVGLNLSYTGTIKDEILEKTEIAFYLLKFLMENYTVNLSQRYKIDLCKIEEYINNNDKNNAVLELMQDIGKRRGAIVSGRNGR